MRLTMRAYHILFLVFISVNVTTPQWVQTNGPSGETVLSFGNAGTMFWRTLPEYIVRMMVEIAGHGCG